MRTLVQFALVLALVCLVSLAHAQAPATAPAPAPAAAYTPNWPEPPSTTSMLLRLFFGTVVVLGLCVASLWYGRRWLQGPQFAGKGGQQLRVVESVSLGNRCAVHLIQIGNTRALAGTDAAGLQSLIELSEPFEDVLIKQLEEDETETKAAA